MKTYSINQLKKLSKEQGYKLAALENATGKRLQSFNKLTTKVDTQLSTIESRLKSEIYEDGIYTVLLSRTINNMQDPDRYQIIKGALKPDHVEIKEATPIVHTKAEEVLTWASALQMQQQISNLTAEVRQLKFENNLLQSQLDAVEDNELSEGTETPGELKSGTQTFLSETLPSFLPIIDRYFDQEDKKLELKKLELLAKKNAVKNPIRKPIEVGSQEHLNIIQHYFTTNQTDKLDRELDKLEQANEPLYLEVCKQLGFEVEPGNDEEGAENEQ